VPVGAEPTVPVDTRGHAPSTSHAESEKGERRRVVTRRKSFATSAVTIRAGGPLTGSGSTGLPERVCEHRPQNRARPRREGMGWTRPERQNTLLPGRGYPAYTPSRSRIPSSPVGRQATDAPEGRGRRRPEGGHSERREDGTPIEHSTSHGRGNGSKKNRHGDRYRHTLDASRFLNVPSCKNGNRCDSEPT
jgi:hypothetical protein